RLELQKGCDVLIGTPGRLLDFPGASARQVREGIARWKAEAERWTDNIYILEGYLARLAGGDREVLDCVKRECYGEEYVEGEGLRELVF
ncbi:hypothetical protein KEM52_002811, partial [Ascosphaera acerosa]